MLYLQKIQVENQKAIIFFYYVGSFRWRIDIRRCFFTNLLLKNEVSFGSSSWVNSNRNESLKKYWNIKLLIKVKKQLMSSFHKTKQSCFKKKAWTNFSDIWENEEEKVNCLKNWKERWLNLFCTKIKNMFLISDNNFPEDRN